MTLSIAETHRRGEEALKLLMSEAPEEGSRARWFEFGESLLLLRAEVLPKAGNKHTGARFNKLMGPLLEEHGYVIRDKNGKDKLAPTRSRLLAIMDRKREVLDWLRDLPGDERSKYNHPITIWQRCPIFHPKVERASRPAASTSAATASAAASSAKAAEPQIDMAKLRAEIEADTSGDAPADKDLWYKFGAISMRLSREERAVLNRYIANASAGERAKLKDEREKLEAKFEKKYQKLADTPEAERHAAEIKRLKTQIENLINRVAAARATQLRMKFKDYGEIVRAIHPDNRPSNVPKEFADALTKACGTLTGWWFDYSGKPKPKLTK